MFKPLIFHHPRYSSPDISFIHTAIKNANDKAVRWELEQECYTWLKTEVIRQTRLSVYNVDDAIDFYFRSTLKE